MKCTIPEISWHNRDPVLSLDIQSNKGSCCFYRLATGGTDSHVLIWLLTVEKGGVASLECAADLTRHTKPVNCVRFSPSGDILASGDDEACIILWKMKTSSDPPEIFNAEEESFKEQWTSVKVLRGHLQDVYDISWSADSKNLISGSVDNTAILWDVSSGKNLGILAEHKGFVQGVAWDPCGQYVATMSSDRVCRVYNASSRRVVSRLYKGHLPGQQAPDAKPAHYFHDDTLKSFFRRLSFTPDGQLLIVPSGLVEQTDKKPTNSTIIFHRNCLQKPVVYLPSLSQYTVAVRCCPVYFTLRQMDSPPLFQLPYRVVIAVATQSSVVLYDTQHAAPFAFITNIHYTRLTDLSWSSDGRVLVVSSTDGYCSVISFAENELGTVYTEGDSQQSDETSTKPMTSVGDDSTLDEKRESAFSLSEDANMPFCSAKDPAQETLGSKPEDSKDKTPQSKTKETPMDVDDFSLVYEGTLGEAVAESKPPRLGGGKDINMKNKPIESCTGANSESNSDNINSLSDEPKTHVKAREHVTKCIEDDEKKESPNKTNDPSRSMQDEALSSPKSGMNVTSGGSSKKTPRRVQLITLSSPKSKKKLLE